MCPSRRIEYCKTADEFYSTMGCLTQEMLEENLFDSAELMQVRSTQQRRRRPSPSEPDGQILRVSFAFQEVYSMAVFPFPQLAELREKYTYNITPFPTSVKANGRCVCVCVPADLLVILDQKWP